MSSIVCTLASASMPQNEMDEFEDWYMGEGG